MAIDKKLIRFKTKENFMSANGVNGNVDTPTSGKEEDGTATYGQVRGASIVFIEDSKEIWTHGNLYKSANWSVLRSGSIIINVSASELETILNNEDEAGFASYVMKNTYSLSKLRTCSVSLKSQNLDNSMMLIGFVCEEDGSDPNIAPWGYINGAELYELLVIKDDKTVTIRPEIFDMFRAEGNANRLGFAIGYYEPNSPLECMLLDCTQYIN